MYDEEGSEGPKGTFEIYKAEADTLYKQGEYRKSIESYTTVRKSPNFLTETFDMAFIFLSPGDFSVMGSCFFFLWSLVLFFFYMFYLIVFHDLLVTSP